MGINTGPYINESEGYELQNETLRVAAEHVVVRLVTNTAPVYFTGSNYGNSGFIPLGTVANAYVKFTDGTDLSCTNLISGRFYPVAIQMASSSNANASIIVTRRS